MNKKAKLVGINHVALAVGDIDQALAFYRTIFDFKIKSQDNEKAFLDMGDQFLALFATNYQPHEDIVRHFGLVVDERTDVLELAQKAGATLSHKTPFMEFTDPWGNLLQVINYKDVEFTKDHEILQKMGLNLSKKNVVSYHATPYNKLYRSRKEKIIAGVCGGLAEYFGIDPTWIRLAFVLFFFLAGSALLVYLIMWLIVPLRPE